MRFTPKWKVNLQMANKFLNLLGICRKAGRLTLGAAKTTELIKAHKVKAIFIANDLSNKTEKELKFATEQQNIRVARTNFTIEELSRALGTPAGVVSTDDEGFANALYKLIEGGNINDD